MALVLRRGEIIVGRLLAGQIGVPRRPPARAIVEHALDRARQHARRGAAGALAAVAGIAPVVRRRSEEHTSELQSLMRISYAVFCLKKKKKQTKAHTATLKCTNKNNTISSNNINYTHEQ